MLIDTMNKVRPKNIYYLSSYDHLCNPKINMQKVIFREEPIDKAVLRSLVWYGALTVGGWALRSVRWTPIERRDRYSEFMGAMQ